jgi:hypothetical protein
MRSIQLCFAIGLALLLALAVSSLAFAQEGETIPGPGPFNTYVEPSQVTADDGGSWELGVEGTAGNLTAATAAERAGMQSWLNGWFTTRFVFSEGSSWEEDFKRSSRGGTENSWLDSVDLMFYVGHGSPGLFTFDNASHDDGTLNSSIDCDTSWGDNDNEWLALTSCQVLADSGLGGMAQCMNRQHLILGFVTNASAHNNYWDTQAYHFGRYLRYGYNMTQSWFNACDIAQRYRTARVVAEETACFNDNPYFSSVCADSYDSDYYWYTHACGTASASQVPSELFGGELPVFKVAPYSLEEATADFNHLGGVFSVPVTPTLQAAGLLEGPGITPTVPVSTPFLVATTGSSALQMDQTSGLYQFTDLNALWNDQQAQQAIAVAAASPNYISQDDAKAIADAFLNQNGLLDSGAQFFEVTQDTVGNLGKGLVSASAVAEAEVPSNNQVLYTRVLTGAAVTAAGATQEISFTVVGPGAKLKVYLPTTAPVGAASVLDTPPIGAQGGWRDVELLVNAATGEQVMTMILPEATIKELYLALDDAVTLNTVPISVSARVIQTATLSYWEMVAGASQGELIPAYELSVLLTDANTNEQVQELVYVPASAKYMRPLAKILDAPTVAQTGGVTLTVNAADATKTLQENGQGAFDFVMGYNGAAGTYLYKWYLGGVEDGNQIPNCSTKTCTFVVPYIDPTKDPQFTLNLVVIDSESPNQSEGTDAANILVQPATYLPTIQTKGQ